MLLSRTRFFRADLTRASSTLLAVCNFHGTYLDAMEPDAARLRFVTNTENATLDYFDGAHCQGKTPVCSITCCHRIPIAG